MTIAIGCKLATTCRGLLEIRSVKKLGKGRRKKRLTLATKRFTAAAGASIVVRIRVSKANRRLIGRSAKFLLEVAPLAGGNPAKATLTIRA